MRLQTFWHFLLISSCLLSSLSEAAPKLFAKSNPELLKFKDSHTKRTLILFAKPGEHQNLARLVNLLLRYPAEPSIRVTLVGIVLSRLQTDPDGLVMDLVTTDREIRIKKTLKLSELQKSTWIGLDSEFNEGVKGFRLEGHSKLKIRWNQTKESLELKGLDLKLTVQAPWTEASDQLRREALTATRSPLQRQKCFEL